MLFNTNLHTRAFKLLDIKYSTKFENFPDFVEYLNDNITSIIPSFYHKKDK